MQVQFLGTGAGVPGKQRNVTAIALKLMNQSGDIWLFDCGEATQHQILHTPIKPRRINAIFITHLHGDHLFGLPGFLGSRSFQGGNSPLTIYGPAGIERFVRTVLEVSGTHLRYPLDIVEIADGSVIKREGYTISVHGLDHGIQSFGYRVMEEDRPGGLLIEKVKAAGIPAGPLYKQLKDRETIEWNGERFDGNEFVQEARPGRILAVCGDTRPCEGSRACAQDADVLIHEATFDQSQEEMAHQYYHSTTAQAAALARSCRVKQLWLTHISARYTLEETELLAAQARALFPASEVMIDFQEMTIPYPHEKKPD